MTERGLGMFCDQCGLAVSADWAFCQSCGAPKPESGQPMTGPSPDAMSTAPAATMVRPSAPAVMYTPPQNLPGMPASFGRRLAARVLDGLILTVVSTVAILVALGIAGGVGHVGATGLILFLIGLYLLPPLVTMAYRIAGEGSRSGQTPGKAAVGIRVVRFGGPDEPVGAGRAAGRYFIAGFGELLLGLGDFAMLWNPEQRTWQDRATGTAVVHTGPEHRKAVGSALLWGGGVAIAGAALMGVLAGTGALPDLNNNSVSYASNTTPYYGYGSSSDGTSTDGTTSDGTDPSSTTDSGVTSGDPVAEAQAVDALLDASDSDRRTLLAGITKVQRCSDVYGGVRDIRVVVNDRADEISQAQALSVDAFHNGFALQNALVSALQASQAADQDYLYWAQQMRRDGCTSGTGPDSGSDDQTATQTKTAFLRIWNPIAARNGLSRRTPANL